MRTPLAFLTTLAALAAFMTLGLWGCDDLEYPPLEDLAQAQGVGPIEVEPGEIPEFDLAEWCLGLMARDPDPCTLCSDHSEACRYTCTEPEAGPVTCGAVDADRCRFAEEQCARCELCAAYAPPPQAEALPKPEVPQGLQEVPVDPDRFSRDPRARAPSQRQGRALPEQPVPQADVPTPAPPPCGVPDGPFDD
ncbi:MAG: hypothetical protein KC613_13435 [Myxococcales bacterium]|nr:hypothetical protein [Myxococcales bacterium]MCB9526393.1 hypothetical protein [Myxococcales bacterium]